MSIHDIKILDEKGKEFGLSRNDFKEFLKCYELDNLTTILENIKKQWLELNPNYKVELYDDEKCLFFLNKHYGIDQTKQNK